MTIEQQIKIDRFLSSLPPEDRRVYDEMSQMIGMQVSEIAKARIRKDETQGVVMDIDGLLQDAMSGTWTVFMETVITNYVPKHRPIGFGRE